MNQRETIEVARVLLMLERMSYSNSNTITDEGGRKVRVDEFIREKTRIWRGSWITPPLRQVVERYATKHNVNLKAEDIDR